LVPVVVSILQAVPHRYELNMSLVTWSVAQNFCREIYTDLAIILSPNDWLRLNEVTTSNRLARPAWAGLYNDVNSWRWSLYDLPLKNAPYRNWGGGEPNNSGGKESCVAMMSYKVWADLDCAFYKAYICYN
ncbi:macrophage mannose receptor 1-like isoform X6, partial [Clarias magur]